MKKNFVCTACGIVITVSLLLTGCKGNAAKATDPSDALLATETTTATENTKATKPTTKATTKPTTKPTTGKTENTKATEATKPAESQKPAASEPAATQKPSETPKATEAPKPTNPPATQAPATEAPKPTETEPPETEPALEPYHYDIYSAMEYGNSYAASQGFVIDYSLNTVDDGYIMTNTVWESVLDDNGGQSDLNSFVIDQILSTMDTLSAAYGTTDWSVVRGLAYIECTTSNGEPAYRIYFLYG